MRHVCIARTAGGFAVAVALAFAASSAAQSFQRQQQERPVVQRPARPETTVEENLLKFKLPDLEGKPVAFPDKRFEGKVVMVDIWGTWCGPCRAETQLLVKTHKENREKGFEIVGIAFERDEDPKARVERIAEYVKESGIEYTVLEGGRKVGGNAPVAKSLPALKNFRGYPTHIFIGRDGKVKTIKIGTSREADLQKTVAELLAEPAPKKIDGEK
jgi:thiol-disulfide isomerase/thioredoxin